VEQSWDLSLWPKPTPEVQQVVNLTVSNFGPPDLSLTGIDYTKLGLPKNFQFPTGGTTTIAVRWPAAKPAHPLLCVCSSH